MVLLVTSHVIGYEDCHLVVAIYGFASTSHVIGYEDCHLVVAIYGFASTSHVIGYKDQFFCSSQVDGDGQSSLT